jgi:phosphomannomutase/phosphoglucomutase
MIPWLLIAALMSETGKTLAQLVDGRIEAYPCSGEINYHVTDSKSTIKKILDHYLPQQPVVDKTDGISVEFADWRFSLRGSNTEPLLRLNIESRANPTLVSQRLTEIERLIQE